MVNMCLGERPTETDEHIELQKKGGGSKPIRKNNTNQIRKLHPHIQNRSQQQSHPHQYSRLKRQLWTT